ncbi:hypothetical protein FHR76_002209 [Rhizobium sp. RAS22]|nr:hypothetical protein [Rhizobium sp. RAS22]
MAVTLTTALKNINEDLVQNVSNIAPSATPVYTAIGKTKSAGTYHETLTDTLAPPNKDNAREENADALVPNNGLVSRTGNFTQIFGGEVFVSGSVDAANTAGKGEFSRQLANKLKEMKTDIEASIVSDNASVGGATRKSAGMAAIIKTNAVENGGSATPGFANNIYGAPTVPAVGDRVVVTPDMVHELASKMYDSGAELKDLLVSKDMKTKLSQILSGNASRWNNAKEKAAYSNVDFYTTDFGEFAIKPHRSISNHTIIAYDPDFWAVATYRDFKTEALGKSGDGRKVQIITELTLEARNEAANGKIAGIKTA